MHHKPFAGGHVTDDRVAGYRATAAAVVDDHAVAAAHGHWPAGLNRNALKVRVVGLEQSLCNHVGHQSAVADSCQHLIEALDAEFCEDASQPAESRGR